MATTVHETEENLLRSTVVQLNKANLLGLNDSAVGAISPATVAGLKTKIAALTVHETEQNFLRQINNGVQKMYDLVMVDSVRELSDADVSAAQGAGLFSTLRTKVTENSGYSNLTGLDAGEQAMTS